MIGMDGDTKAQLSTMFNKTDEQKREKDFIIHELFVDGMMHISKEAKRRIHGTMLKLEGF